MRELFTVDMKDYTSDEHVLVRPSVRGIVTSEGKLLVIRSHKHDYYKYPGGGIDAGEKHIQALCREVREEAGRIILPASVREYGNVHRISRGVDEYAAYDLFIQDNFYYLADIEERTVPVQYDAYEALDDLEPVFVYPQEIIKVNRTHDHHGADPAMIERETHVTELLIQEGIL